MIQVTRQLRKPRCFNPNGFEKTECVDKKLKNIAPNSWLTTMHIHTQFDRICAMR